MNMRSDHGSNGPAHLKLIRYLHLEQVTIGYLRLPKFLEADTMLWTFERPYIDNDFDGLSDPNVSCIKTGTYTCRYIKQSKSGKYKDTWFLQMPSRASEAWHRKGILIHTGNYPSDTKGCILVGMDHDKKGLLKDSKRAMDLLRGYIGWKDFTLTISNSSGQDSESYNKAHGMTPLPA